MPVAVPGLVSDSRGRPARFGRLPLPGTGPTSGLTTPCPRGPGRQPSEAEVSRRRPIGCRREATMVGVDRCGPEAGSCR